MPSSYLQKLVWHWQNNPVTRFGRHSDGWVPDAYVYLMRISTSAALRADPHEEEATRAGPTACGGGRAPFFTRDSFRPLTHP